MPRIPPPFWRGEVTIEDEGGAVRKVVQMPVWSEQQLRDYGRACFDAGQGKDEQR